MANSVAGVCARRLSLAGGLQNATLASSLPTSLFSLLTCALALGCVLSCAAVRFAGARVFVTV